MPPKMRLQKVILAREAREPREPREARGRTRGRTRGRITDNSKIKELLNAAY